MNKRWLDLNIHGALLLVVVVLSGCGEGGGSSAYGIDGTVTPPTSPSGPTLDSRQLVVAFDATLAAETRNRVSTFATPFGSAPTGSSVQAPRTDAYNVLALNVSGDLLLATHVPAGWTTGATVSTRSTAIYAARRSLNLKALGMAAPGGDEWIASSPSFSALVAAIERSVAAGESFVASEAAVKLSLDVAGEATEALKKALTSNLVSSAPSMRKLAVDTPRLDATGQDGRADTEEDAFVVLNNNFGDEFAGIRVEGLDTGRLSVSNSTLLDWALNTEDANGKASSIPPENLLVRIEGDRRVLIPGAKLSLFSLTSGIKPKFKPSTAVVYNGSTAAITSFLILQQTETTAASNFSNLMGPMFDVLEGFVPGECLKAIVNLGISQRDMAFAVSAGKFDVALKQLDLLSSGDWLSILSKAKSLSECAFGMSAETLVTYLVPQLKLAIKVISTATKFGKWLESYFFTSAEIYRQFMLFGDRSMKHIVCLPQSRDRLVNCTESVTLLPYTAPGEAANYAPSILIGQTLPLRAGLLDAKGQPSERSRTLKVLLDGRLADDLLTPSPFVLCTVSCTDAFSGVPNFIGQAISSLPLLTGKSKVVVRDVATGVEGAAMFIESVSSGTLKLDSDAALAVGSERLVKLVDAKGRTIFGGKDVTWSSTDANVIEVAAKAHEFDPIVATVKAKAATSSSVVVSAWLGSNGTGRLLAQLNLNVPAGAADFVFEDAKFAAGPECTRYLGQNGYSPVKWSLLLADFDLCSQYVEPVVRCVGEGCVSGRFYVSVSEFTTTTIKQEVLYDGASGATCAGEFDEFSNVQQLYGYTPIYSSAGWFPVSKYNSPVYPTSTYNSYLTGFPIFYRRNIDSIQFVPLYAPPYPHVCFDAGYRWTLKGKIYDTFLRTYRDFTMNMRLP